MPKYKYQLVDGVSVRFINSLAADGWRVVPGILIEEHSILMEKVIEEDYNMTITSNSSVKDLCFAIKQIKSDKVTGTFAVDICTLVAGHEGKHNWKG